ncbi:hypothetical protein [Propionispora vibrioides]|uniref:Uncharacterized protein n=1 Tax=Propionispora vibrioides TaxID=112903 RepID=A0A1H8UK79_9FIRM|nr:hypothetical protein [Propionispora vibrioides]SEP03264.1 hypothetical protein SAMN04490178_1091 [Propionispora vibrioides]
MAVSLMGNNRRLTASSDNRNVLVTIDDRLIRPNGRASYSIDHFQQNIVQMNINLFSLVYLIGTVQVRRLSPSNRDKFYDFEYILSYLKRDPELKVEISLIRTERGSEVLRQASEDLGVGLAAIVADQLYGIRLNTLRRILTSGLRPDFTCFTHNNEELVIESKGTCTHIDEATIQHAQEQKGTANCNISIVSISRFQENTISEVEFLDPPTNDACDNLETRIRIAMAEHYASVFSLIGQAELSRYFLHMKNRLLYDTQFPEFEEKTYLFTKIKNRYTKLNIQNKIYYGRIEQIDKELHRFSGIDERLLTINEFWSFEEYREDTEFVEDNNTYYIFRDGLCIIDIKNLRPFKKKVKGRIKNIQESTKITDVDHMNIINFENYIKYVFSINGWDVEHGNENFDLGWDLIVKKADKKYGVELKLASKPQREFSFDAVIKPRKGTFNKLILITNRELKNYVKFRNIDNIVIIDRPILRQIIEDSTYLSRII